MILNGYIVKKINYIRIVLNKLFDIPLKQGDIFEGFQIIRKTVKIVSL